MYENVRTVASGVSALSPFHKSSCSSTKKLCVNSSDVQCVTTRVRSQNCKIDLRVKNNQALVTNN